MQNNSVHSQAPAETFDDRLKGSFYMLLAGIFFTANVLLLRAFEQKGGAWLSSGFRFAVGCLVCLFLTGKNSRGIYLRLFTQTGLIMRGIIGGAGVVCFYAAIPGLGAGKATFIQTCYVVLAPVLAVSMLDEKLSRKTLFLVALAMMGMFLLSGVGMKGWSIDPAFILAVLAALLSAWAVLLIRKLSRTEPSATIFAAQCVYGLLICLIPSIGQWGGISMRQAGVYLTCGLFAAGGQLLLTVGFRYLTVAEGCLLNMITAVMISLGGRVIFHEAYRFSELLGAFAILISCSLIQIPMSLKRK